MNITFENNLYDAQPWQGLFHWGVEWKRHKKYTSLADVRRELRFESGGNTGEFPIENYRSRDFRVPPDSPALKAGCYPRGEIPGTKLDSSSSALTLPPQARQDDAGKGEDEAGNNDDQTANQYVRVSREPTRDGFRPRCVSAAGWKRRGPRWKRSESETSRGTPNSRAQGPRARDGAATSPRRSPTSPVTTSWRHNKCRGSVPIWRRLKGKDQGPEQGEPRSGIA